MTTSFLITVALASLKLTKKGFLIRVDNNKTINIIYTDNVPYGIVFCVDPRAEPIRKRRHIVRTLPYT